MRRLIALVIDSWSRARASVAAETLLKRAGSAGDASRLGNAAVAYAWRRHSAYLSGARGERPPHEVAAVFALALACRHGALGQRATPTLRAAVDAGIGKRGLYRERSRQWTQPTQAELLAYAQRVNDDPDAAIAEPGESATPV